MLGNRVDDDRTEYELQHTCYLGSHAVLHQVTIQEVVLGSVLHSFPLLSSSLFPTTMASTNLFRACDRTFKSNNGLWRHLSTTQSLKCQAEYRCLLRTEQLPGVEDGNAAGPSVPGSIPSVLQ